MPLGIALLALFVLVPLAEIAVLIRVGGLLGLWPTLALVVLTAVAGSVVIRLQGVAVLERVRREIEAGEVPVEGVLDGLCLLAAGALLLTPGFLTDTLGACLLVPPLRRALYRRLQERLARRRFQAEAEMRRRQGGPPPLIEGEFEEVAPERPRQRDERRRDDGMPPPRGGWGPS
jgi:UPF0716 protein FxsA